MDSEKAIDHIVNQMRAELPSSLKYHSVDHTLHVMKSARCIAEAEEINGEELELLLTAAAYHDSGLLRTYQQHEEVSCKIAAEALPRFGYTDDQIRKIQGMIRATRIPQQPQNHLEKILSDADLHYLGGDNYDEISRRLYEEMVLHGFDLDERKWLDVQINFLEKHHFWTTYSVSNQAPAKKQVLSRLLAEKQSMKHSG